MTVSTSDDASPFRTIGEEAVAFRADGAVSLLGSRCRSCETLYVPPAPVCPGCGGEDVVEEVQPSQGTLYSYTRVHVGPGPWRKPVVLGYVDLDNGVRVFTHLAGDGWAIGDRMRLAAGEVGVDADGTRLRTYVFERKDDDRV